MKVLMTNRLALQQALIGSDPENDVVYIPMLEEKGIDKELLKAFGDKTVYIIDQTRLFRDLANLNPTKLTKTKDGKIKAEYR